MNRSRSVQPSPFKFGEKVQTTENKDTHKDLDDNFLLFCFPASYMVGQSSRACFFSAAVKTCANSMRVFPCRSCSRNYVSVKIKETSGSLFNRNFVDSHNFAKSTFILSMEHKINFLCCSSGNSENLQGRLFRKCHGSQWLHIR